MGARAYQQTMQSIAEPRDSEAKVFSAVTGGLERHKEEGRKSPLLKEWLARNQKLWNALRTNVSTTENQLPADLRARLLSLSMWVDRHTAAFLRGEAEIDDLIAVNRAVAAGLAGAR